MPDLLKFIIIFTSGEFIASEIFAIVRYYYQQPRRITWPIGSVFKGVLERLVMFVGLWIGFAHILTLFGALKIGTRLDSDKSQRVSNDYFLVGNLLSVFLVLIYHTLLTKWTTSS